jgi:hypothetical protein
VPGPPELAAGDEAAVDLLELIEVGWIVEGAGEVGPEVSR